MINLIRFYARSLRDMNGFYSSGDKTVHDFTCMRALQNQMLAVQKGCEKVNKLNYVMLDSDPLIFSPRSDISCLYQRQEILNQVQNDNLFGQSE